MGAQSDKRDYIWLFGHNSGFGEGVEAYMFDFNTGSTPKSIQGVPPFELFGNNASICDKDGNLLYYSNGCHIAGSDNKIIENGSDINYGEWITIFRNDTCEFYPTTQDILFLDDPGSPDGHYLVHKPIEIGEPRYKSLRYSYIERTLGNDNGAVTIKGEHILDGIKFLYSYLTAVPHANGEDWWLIQVDDQELIHSILLDDSGFRPVNEEKIPVDFGRNSSASGKPKFSPDGSMYAFYNPYDDLHLYDFDRETGAFSNRRYLLIEDFPDEIARGSAVEWSPDSRFIYITIQDQLWQVDTWETELEDGLELIDTWNGGGDPFPNQFFLMNLAPDCKIYMCGFSSASTYHVINNPNAKGQDCDFVQQGIRLPHVSASATMPNFPRYRVDEEDKCDPTITSIFGEDIYWRKDLVTYPNPVVDQLTIELPDGEKGRLYVFDTAGQLLWQSKETYTGSEVQLDMSGYATGTYSVEFVPEENKERRLWTSWVVKVD